MKHVEMLHRRANIKYSSLNVWCSTFAAFLPQGLLSAVVFFILVFESNAVTSGLNPYSGIVERNSFGLKPPVNPADLVKPPAPVFADIKLQGITTILNRKQVLMKVKLPARPPEPAREQALVLSEGQREGEVEVLEINVAGGTVKVNNNGTVLLLNMKDNAEKPTPGVAVPGAPGVPPSGLPGVPPPGIPTAAVPAATSTTVDSFGGNKSIPTRTLRTSAEGGIPTTHTGSASASANLNAQIQAAAQRSPEENVLLFEANRLRRQQSGSGFLTTQQHPAIGGTGLK